MGFTEIVAVQRSGELREGDWVAFSDTLDGLIDLRGAADGVEQALAYFGRYAGRVLSTADQDDLARRASDVVMGASRQHGVDPRLFDEIARYGPTDEGFLARAWWGFVVDRPEIVYESAAEILRRNATLPTTMSAALALWRADLDPHAVGDQREEVERACSPPSDARRCPCCASVFDRRVMVCGLCAATAPRGRPSGAGTARPRCCPPRR